MLCTEIEPSLLKNRGQKPALLHNLYRLKESILLGFLITLLMRSAFVSSIKKKKAVKQLPNYGDVPNWRETMLNAEQVNTILEALSASLKERIPQGVVPPLLPADYTLKVPGEHNRENAALAAEALRAHCRAN